MVEMHSIYKIRRKKDGLFSCGNCWEFNKNSKAWVRLQYLKRHITENSHKYNTHDCEILEYKLSEIFKDVKTMMNEMQLEKGE